MKTLLDKEVLIFNPPQLGCVLSLTGLPGGGSKIYDRSPYGNIGTITGATWVRLPSGLWCLSFDGGDDYVDCGNANSLRITGSLTLAAWVKPAGNNTNKDIIGNVDYVALPYLGYRLTLGATSDIEFRVEGGGETRVNAQILAPYSADEWIQLVAVYDISVPTLYLYKNGVDTEGTISGTIPSSLNSVDHNVYIAAGENNGSAIDYFFNGPIALPRVYNRVLSALEIQNHFNREKHLFGVW